MTPAPLTEPIPHVCTVRDVLRFCNLSKRTFYRLLADHRLPLVELDRLGRSRRFSGASVEAHARGRWARSA